MSSMNLSHMRNTFTRTFLYFAKGTIVADTGLWLLDAAGTASEFVLLAAVIFITAYATEKPFVTSLTGISTGVYVFHLCITLFIVLPEIVTLDGIVKVIRLWKYGRMRGSKSDIVWAVLFSLPTLAFLILTVITLVTQITPGASPVLMESIVAGLMVPRALSVFMYAIIKGVHRAIALPTLHTEHLTACTELDATRKTLDTKHQDIIVAQKEIAQLQSDVEEYREKFYELENVRQTEAANYQAMISSLQTEKQLLQNTFKLSQRSDDEVIRDSWLGMTDPTARKVATDTGMEYQKVSRILKQLSLKK